MNFHPHISQCSRASHELSRERKNIIIVYAHETPTIKKGFTLKFMLYHIIRTLVIINSVALSAPWMKSMYVAVSYSYNTYGNGNRAMAYAV